MTAMQRELLLLRHGKSDWSAGTNDFHRPLKLNGKRSAQRVATWLVRQGLVPDHVLSSPAERASATAAKVCKTIGIGMRAIHMDERLYEARLDDLLSLLADCPARAQRVLLVGHNPGLEELLAFLSPDAIPAAEKGRLLSTATLARLVMPDDWHRLTAGCAGLAGFTRPAALPLKFPFPALYGPEWRKRPAYYYTQSAVIPFQLRQGKPEILVISSSRNKHWVIPKGIKEPGLSSRESAAKEAWEEAGAEGRVFAEPLGVYTCKKWGASCNVEVFAMEVTHLVPERKWEESHRAREWVTPKEAVKRLKHRELRPLVMALAKRLRAQ
jgi:phosphohistidine phosphatase